MCAILDIFVKPVFAVFTVFRDKNTELWISQDPKSTVEDSGKNYSAVSRYLPRSIRTSGQVLNHLAWSKQKNRQKFSLKLVKSYVISRWALHKHVASLYDLLWSSQPPGWVPTSMLWLLDEVSSKTPAGHGFLDTFWRSQSLRKNVKSHSDERTHWVTAPTPPRWCHVAIQTSRMVIRTHRTNEMCDISHTTRW